MRAPLGSEDQERACRVMRSYKYRSCRAGGRHHASKASGFLLSVILEVYLRRAACIASQGREPWKGAEREMETKKRREAEMEWEAG